MRSLLNLCCVILLVKICVAKPILTATTPTEIRCSGGILKAEENKLDFLLLSGSTSELKLILVHNSTSSYMFTTSNEGSRWNYYSIWSNNKTVYIRKNGHFIKRYDNLDLQKITAKISSNDSFWKIWNVCGHGVVEPCKITCPNYEDFNIETEEESKASGHGTVEPCKICNSNNQKFNYKTEENIKEHPPNSSGGSRFALINIVLFLVLTYIACEVIN